MADLVVFRGLPASGKTTLARQWVAYGPNRARVNRDELRSMLHDGVYSPSNEVQIVAARDAIIDGLLALGVSVVSDDTNLKPEAYEGLVKIAHAHTAVFKVYDLTAVPVEVCVVRDMARDASVGEDVIRQMAVDYLPLA